MSLNPIAIANYLAEYFLTRPTGDIVVAIIFTVGWLAMLKLLIYLVLHLLEELQQDRYAHKWEWVLLAVDVPPLNVQTPKAVEQLFTHLAGAFDAPNIAEKYYYGYKQRWFSFEIISIEGYIQFLIRTEVQFRDLVEAAIYAQYPEASITEVEDYVAEAPSIYPNDTHDIWAADFGLSEGDAFPIRTYRDFEHSISKDTVLKDPMGTFLESFSRIGPGEQVWFQIIIEPISNHWKEKVIEKVKELIGEEKEHGKRPFAWLTDNPLTKEIGHGIGEIGAQLTGTEYVPADAAHEESGEPNKLRYLTPGNVKIVEAMEAKIAKIGFKTKIRAVYLARKEVFRPERAVQAVIGAMTQYNIPSANSLVPSFGVKTSYWFKQQRTVWRKRLLMQAYKKRKIKPGGKPFILNIEELATVWHFPMSHVMTPLLQKAEGKRAEPPPGLPIESIAAPVKKAKPEPARREYKTDAGDVEYGEVERFG